MREFIKGMFGFGKWSNVADLIKNPIIKIEDEKELIKDQQVYACARNLPGHNEDCVLLGSRDEIFDWIKVGALKEWRLNRHTPETQAEMHFEISKAFHRQIIYVIDTSNFATTGTVVAILIPLPAYKIAWKRN